MTEHRMDEDGDECVLLFHRFGGDGSAVMALCMHDASRLETGDDLAGPFTDGHEAAEAAYGFLTRLVDAAA